MENENSSASRNSLVSSKHDILRSKLLKGTVPLGSGFFFIKKAVDFYLDLFIYLFMFIFSYLFVYLFVFYYKNSRGLLHCI